MCWDFSCKVFIRNEWRPGCRANVTVGSRPILSCVNPGRKIENVNNVLASNHESREWPPELALSIKLTSSGMASCQGALFRIIILVRISECFSTSSHRVTEFQLQIVFDHRTNNLRSTGP